MASAGTVRGWHMRRQRNASHFDRERDALEPARTSRLSVADLTIARHTFAADLAQLPEQLRSTLDKELRSAAQALRNAQALVELVYLAAIPEIIDLSRELARLLARAKI